MQYKNKEIMYQKLIIENKSYQQTAKELECSFTAVRNWAIKFGLNKEFLYMRMNEQIGKEIINDYLKTGVLIKDLKLKYGVDYHVIKKIFQLNNIEIKDRKTIKKELDRRNLCRTLKVDHDYFKTWSSNMAYILGFISADGCILKNRNTLRINLKCSDKEILHKIKNELNFDGQVYERSIRLKEKMYQTSELSITSRTLIDDLKRLGISERKSLVIELPKCLPEQYELDFIRGYFDGDGSVGGQYPTNSNKTKAKTIQIRVRICSGSLNILTQMRDILTKHGLKKVPVNSDTKRKNYYEFVYSTKESIKFYQLIYRDLETLYLERKKQKFDELITLRN